MRKTPSPDAVPVKMRPVCRSRKVRRAPGTGIVILEKPASRTMPSSAVVVNACWRGMRTGTAAWRDCCVMAPPDCGVCDADESPWFCGGAPAKSDTGHAVRQHSTPSKRRIRRGEIRIMGQTNKQLGETLHPNDHRASGNRYYITILGTPEQQFSAAHLRYWSPTVPGSLRHPHKNPHKNH